MVSAVTGSNFYGAWESLLRKLIYGDKRSPRGIPTREQLGVTFRVENALHNILVHPIRELNYKFMVAEWLWIMSGSNKLRTIAQYNSKLAEFSDDGEILEGAYGPRVLSQFSWLTDKLKESDTRQAVISIWTPKPVASKDIPCTLTLQFLRRTDTISLIVNMRSSDIWLGLPYDFFAFSQLLSCICGELECVPGFVQFNLGSSHVYERDLEIAMRLLDGSFKGNSLASLGVTGMPPRWLLDVLESPKINPISHVEPWLRYARVLTNPRSQALSILAL